MVLLLGLATYVRLVQINAEEARTVPGHEPPPQGVPDHGPGLEPYFSTGHHDDERGLAASYLMAGPREPRPLAHFLVTTPTIVATVDAALATVIVVLVVQAVDASTAAAVVAGTVTFATGWGTLDANAAKQPTVVRRSTERFPTPPGER